MQRNLHVVARLERARIGFILEAQPRRALQQHHPFGVRLVVPEPRRAGLAGGDAATNAHLLQATLAGAPGAIRVAALMAAAASLYVVGAVSDLRAGARQAAAALDNGGARAVVDHLRRLSPVQKKE